VEAERLTPPLNDGGNKKQSSLDESRGFFVSVEKAAVRSCTAALVFYSSGF